MSHDARRGRRHPPSSRRSSHALRATLGAALALAVGLAVATGSRRAHAAEELVVRDAWVREASPTDRASGGYLTVENPGATPVQLVGADVEGVGVVEMHVARLKDEMMSMERVHAITIPARGRADLKPGGHHLMLFKLTKPLEAGASVRMTLRFSDGQVRTVSATVRGRTTSVPQ